ncbi:uncharacterized protein LY89DRAFT_44812 [Mollisia scopiformis]|uniref:Uncharacterized protein n=1 Tax=Mollisia scopiformis TaxID=149040 RepID=A0A194XDQ4_MOLSC|nr:uncharacterized protein LY89DRAFT_44812 [Mollisia scopiformis]KUJ18284.1 hypothetical protein LY89DRAFT_44812 [Mollisia scopiformis]
MAAPFRAWLDSDEVPAIGFATTPRRVESPDSFFESLSKSKKAPESGPLSFSRTSTSSSSGSSDGSVTDDTPSRKSSASTAPSTAPSIDVQVPWHVHVAHLPQPTAVPITARYSLPCEFLFAGCQIAFPPDEYENWILHSLTHFPRSDPPKKCVCTICDNDDAVFSTEGDQRSRILNWSTRMHHIGEHFEHEYIYEDMRPDFFVIKHVESRLNEEDFKSAMSYSERPPINNLVSYGFKTPAMRRQERRDNAQFINQRDEDRRRERQRRLQVRH